HEFDPHGKRANDLREPRHEPPAPLQQSPRGPGHPRAVPGLPGPRLPRGAEQAGRVGPGGDVRGRIRSPAVEANGGEKPGRRAWRHGLPGGLPAHQVPARRAAHGYERLRCGCPERRHAALRMVGGERQPARRVPGLHARAVEDVAAVGDRHGLTGTASRALVTGGAGFIGSHIVDRLVADGHDVCVLDDLSTGSASNVPPDARLQRLDICGLASLREVFADFRPEVVFHAAAQTDVRRSVREPDFDARVNVLGGLNVLRAAVAGGAKRIVYASSAAVYGTPPPGRAAVTETDPTRPMSEYGASKLALEHYLSAYAARGLIEYAALRYANVYGPRQRSDGEAGVVSIFTRQMLAGEPVTIFGDGTKTRDYVYVGDVVEVTIRAAAGPSGVVANVGWGREVSDLDLFRAVARETGYAREPI